MIISSPCTLFESRLPIMFLLFQKPFPVDNLKKCNKNAKPNKDIFLYPKIQNKQQDIILMLMFYYISTDLRSQLSGNRLIYSRFTNKMIKLVEKF